MRRRPIWVSEWAFFGFGWNFIESENRHNNTINTPAPLLTAPYTQSFHLLVGTVKEAEEHTPTCSYQCETCELCHQDMFASTIHLHMNQCPVLIAQGCPIQGCSYVPENKCGEKLKLHMQEYAIYHAFLQNKAQREMQSQIITLVADVAEKDEQLKVSKELLKTRNEETEELMEELKSAREEIQQTNEQVTSLNATVQQQMQTQAEIIRRMNELRTAQQQPPPPPPPPQPQPTEATNSEITRVSKELSLLNHRVSDLDLRQQLFEVC